MGALSTMACAAQEAPFVRGDVDADLQLDIADPICALSYLFSTVQDSCKDTVVQCLDAADANDDGEIDIADAIAMLLSQFGGAGPLPEPYEACGPDPTDDGINTSDGGGAQNGNFPLYINGGYTAVYAGGNGLDANGPITMTGGQVLVHGPTSNGNGALDYATFTITGGVVVAAGSSGMAEAPGGNTSTQYAVLVNLDSTYAANTLFHVRRSDGTEIVTYKPSKTYQSVGFTSPALARNATYDVCTGGTSTGTVTDGLYAGGTYTGGTKYTSFTISSLVTRIGGGGPSPPP